MEAGAPADAVGELKALFEVGVGGWGGGCVGCVGWGRGVDAWGWRRGVGAWGAGVGKAVRTVLALSGGKLILPCRAMPCTRQIIGVGGSSGVSSGGGSALSRGGGSAEAFLPPLLQRASNSSSAAAFNTTPGGGASSTGYTDADAAAGPWAPRTAAVAHFIGACAGLPAAQVSACGA